MSQLFYRSNTLLPSLNSEPAFGANYTVVAYEVGGQVDSASSGISVSLRAGHGFATNDRFIVEDSAGDIDVTTYRGVSNVSGDTLTISGALSVAAGGRLINLGPDTGTTAPKYDGSPIDIYSDMAGVTTPVSDSEVTCDAEGNYEYWTQAQSIWELARDSGGDPTQLLPDAVQVTTAMRGTVLPSTGSIGQTFIKDGGAGVADRVYMWIKASDDTYDWTETGGA